MSVVLAGRGDPATLQTVGSTPKQNRHTGVYLIVKSRITGISLCGLGGRLRVPLGSRGTTGVGRCDSSLRTDAHWTVDTRICPLHARSVGVY